jgi:hypothetical protein
MAGAFLMPWSGFAQTVFNVMENTSYFGWLDQYSLDNSTYHFVGAEACVPTSSTNAMTYLQNLAPSYFGSALTGTGYSSWMSTDTLLISAPYMDTTPSDGTYYDHIPFALNKYIVEDNGFSAVLFSGIFPSDYWGGGGYSKPSYILDGNPTSGFFLNSLGAGNATIFSILYGGVGGGHELLAAGLNWIDGNDDGIIQFSENAALYFVDPLDPAGYDSNGLPVSGPKITSGHLWNDAGFLKMDYLQYSGSLPYSAGSYSYTGTVTIDTVFAIAVPEPSSVVLILVGFVACGLCSRRSPIGRVSANRSSPVPETDV